MPELKQSKRRFYTGTYVPLRKADTPEDDASGRVILRGWTKLSYLLSLDARTEELSAVRNLAGSSADGASLLKLVDRIEPVLGDRSPVRSLRHVRAIAGTSVEDLANFGRLLGQTRKQVRRDVAGVLADIRTEYRNLPSSGPAANIANTSAMTMTAMASVPSASAPAFVAPGEFGSRSELLRWSSIHDRRLIERLNEIADSVGRGAGSTSSLRIHAADLTIAGDLVAWTDLSGDSTDDLVDGFEESMTVEPVGRLHLERIEMLPVGIQRGELLYTVPMSPGETVTIQEKEWSIRNEEFERLVSDTFEGFSETGVTEKNDLSQSSQSQSVRASAFSLSGSYSYLGGSAAIGYTSSAADSHAAQEARNHSVAITRKASSRVKRDHKYSFKVGTVEGEERVQGRVIKNPSTTDVKRLEYYQLMRKWRVDLYRYGLRMTYDIVIPNPGADLLKKIDEIDAIDMELTQPHEFDLSLNQITRATWSGLAAKYNAVVDPPPLAMKTIELNKVYTDDDTKDFFDVLDFSVEEDYEVLRAHLIARFDPDNDDLDEAYFDALLDDKDRVRATGQDFFDEGLLVYERDQNRLVGQSGDFTVSYVGQKLREGIAHLIVLLSLRPEGFALWQLKARGAMREASENAYFQRQAALKQRREALEAELGSSDALSLRRMEREEVMKGVLRWLFGPSFQLVPDEIEDLLRDSEGEPSNLRVEEWSRVLGYGEFIKFLQQAVEWENVLFFTYPYFWSPVKRELKRWLRHPDPRHQDFLRAGAARVVLTIRPGFEESFASLMETGAFGSLSPDHPYLTIAEEIRNFAETNYPGIPPANPAGDDDEELVEEREQGILTGRWFEYTPTSALDLAIDTPDTDLA